ncbi:hypothetical protein [Undibacterium sp. RuTC16W]|uniref:hypothetical protein n=1 Tax=Undibacterium sp. RuTC16W TaxID=3413048 RepID=UPI003BF41162
MATAPSKKTATTDKPVAKAAGKIAVVPAKKIATAAKLVAIPADKPATKPATKSAVKPATKSATKKTVAKVKPVAKVAAAKSLKPAALKPASAKPVAAKAAVAAIAKVKKEKLVRDSFTMPESEYEVLSSVKKACLSAGIEVKKSQLLRIGLVLLNKANVTELKTLINALAPLKAGRPKKDK